MARVLIVDDEVSLRRMLAAIVRSGGHESVEADGVGEAQTALGSTLFDVVLTDQRMRDGDGLSLLAACRESDPALPVIMVTAHASVELAVEAMRAGAFDFLAKPFHPDQVLAVVARAGERSELLRENRRLRGEVARQSPTATTITGTSPAIAALRDLVSRVAPTPATVLVTGETGTGKELVARAIHAGSERADRPFVAVNCAAFAETLLDSELFGHERGAFTGADRSRPGLFEAAHRGTLFLDEAGEMSLGLQAKLLRVLMDGDVVRVGATAPRRVDVRLVVATHRDLRARAQEGLFRQDLYYRLAVVPIRVPALRERRADLPELAMSLLREVAVALNQPIRPIAPAALAKLARYDFPGNVRELRNLLERAAILARRPEIGVDDLPELDGDVIARPAAGEADALEAWIATLPERLDLRAVIADVDAALVRRALAAAGGVQAEAARRLGLSRSDLSYRLRRRGDELVREF
jgi:DNA-binding NtrC family response regulator